MHCLQTLGLSVQALMINGQILFLLIVPFLPRTQSYKFAEISANFIRLKHRVNEYYYTVVIATEKLSNSEAKPRYYDNFEGDNNRVVIFLKQHLLRSFQN